MGTRMELGELVTAVALVAIFAAMGCSRAKPAFDCDRPGASCGDTAGAICVDDRCAIPSTECASGLEYADNAGDLAGTCVGGEPAIDGSTGQFTVTVPGDEVYLRPGASVTVSATVSRLPGFTEAIDVTIDGLPAELTAESITIAPGETNGMLTLEAAATAVPGTAASAQVTGRAAGFENASSLPVLVVGTPGTLDESFGTGGQVGDSFLTSSLIVQASGKIIVGGGGKAIRYDDTGVLDGTFGISGILEHDFVSLGGNPGSSVLVAAQSDGKIVAVTTLRASSNGDVALLRYDEDGVPDPTFRWRHAFGNASTSVEAVTIGPQDEIVVTGHLQIADTASDAFVARFLPNGDLDESFDGDGLVSWSLDTADTTNDVAVQVDGKVLVLTTSFTGQMNDPSKRRLVRFNADGAIDLLFASSGVLTFSGMTPFALDVVVDAGGDITVAGSVNSALVAGDQAVWRYTNQGQPHPGFGTAGLWSAPPTMVSDGMTVALTAPDGSVYAAGTVSTDFIGGDPVVVHLDAIGGLDPGFGSGGTATPTGIGVAIIKGALLPDHRLVIMGNSFDRFRLVRLWY